MFNLFNRKRSDGETFWDWLAANLPALREEMKADPQKAGERMGRAFSKHHPGLEWEMGSLDADPIEFYVSANGHADKFPRVLKVVQSAPPIPGCVVKAFRPRGDVAGAEIEMAGRRLSCDDVWFTPEPAGDRVHLTVWVRGYDEDEESIRGTAATILIDHAVGEYDAAMKLGELRVEPLPDDPTTLPGAAPLSELPAYLDRIR